MNTQLLFLLLGGSVVLAVCIWAGRKAVADDYVTKGWIAEQRRMRGSRGFEGAFHEDR